jgi:hypothetical protein
MKAPNPWITYRTRFLVKGKQLTTSLTFTDLLGRQHSGRKGDYLVESSDGVLSIAPRRIFEDIYVPVLAGETPARKRLRCSRALLSNTKLRRTKRPVSPKPNGNAEPSRSHST